MAERFASKASRFPIVSRVFLQPLVPVFLHRPINHWYITWWINLHWQQQKIASSTISDHHFHSLREQRDRRMKWTNQRPVLVNLSRRLQHKQWRESRGDYNDSLNEFNWQASPNSVAELASLSLGRPSRIFASRFSAEKPFHRSERLPIGMVWEKAEIADTSRPNSLTQPFFQTPGKALRIFASRFPPENYLHRLGQVPTRMVWEKAQISYMSMPDSLSQRFFQLRQRIERRLSKDQVLTHNSQSLLQEGLLQKLNSEPHSALVLRKNYVVRHGESARSSPEHLPITNSNVLFSATPPQLDLNRLTDQIMKQIDRRLVIWRERTGRV